MQGEAQVLSVEACPCVTEHGSRLVTAVYRHCNGKVCDLKLGAENKSIGVTASHPVWSADRNDWVSVGDLRVYERLKTLDGYTRVEWIRHRQEPEPVYNIEVEGDHVYRIGESGVLVHNNSVPDPVFNVQLRNATGSPIGEFDEIKLSDSTFVEEKRASLSGLQIQAQRRGITIEQAAQEWAELQIYQKTSGRITALQNAAETRPEEGGTRPVPSICDIQSFRIFSFRIAETDARVRTAVDAQIQRLRQDYPGWTFELEA